MQSNEQSAIAFGANSSKVEHRLWQAASLLLPSYRKTFDIKSRFNAQDRTLTSGDDRYLLRWTLRNKPDQPAGYLNQQNPQGIVHFEMIGAFEINPNS